MTTTIRRVKVGKSVLPYTEGDLELAAELRDEAPEDWKWEDGRTMTDEEIAALARYVAKKAKTLNSN
jgi:hypothetical protein